MSWRRVRQECKASSIIRTDIDPSRGPSCSDPSILFFFFFSGINESASVLPLLLPGSIQGLLNQAHSFLSFCVPFLQISELLH